MRKTTFKASITAFAVATVLGTCAPAWAADNTSGTIQGVVELSPSQSSEQISVTISNQATGFSKTIGVSGEGNYRLPKLSAGTYDVEIKQGDAILLTKTVLVSIGRDTVVDLNNTVERIAVTGQQVYLDTTSAESGLNISAADLIRLPVPRDVTSVAMLAPSVTLGDQSFGDSGQSFASFGGASIAENAFFINGLNVTNFRNGLGGSGIPFEFYESFEVKTGGYSVEFGRSTGGVVNAVTKRGTNEFKAGASVYYDPDSLREDSPNTLFRDGSTYIDNSQDSTEKLEANIYASGALIEDTLFFYALYTHRDIELKGVPSGQLDDLTAYKSDDPFWGLKLDWQINEDHAIELTAFSDETDNPTQTIRDGELIGTLTEARGGKNYIARYTGYLTDNFTMSAMYGINEYDLTALSTADQDCPVIVDVRASRDSLYPGCWVNSVVETGSDERKASRIDFEWQLQDHLLRFGFDREVNTSFSGQDYSGGVYYRYIDVTPGSELNNGGIVPDGVTQVVRDRKRTVAGNFETISSAYYLEDIWNVTDNVTVTAGIRNETFDNKNSNGDSFIKLDNQWAPRLGVIWDVDNDGRSRVFANYGRYFLPVASNTNIRLAGSEDDRQRFYALDAVDPVTGLPTFSTANEIGTELVTSNGQISNPLEIVDQTIKPMYQDEVILGYEALVGEEWSMGVRGVYRDLAVAMDDICNIDPIMVDRGFPDNHIGCILTNPGTSMKIYYPDASGELVPVSLTADELGFEEAQRQYLALEYTFQKAWDGVWNLQGSYVWAHSWGNAEGYVKSDNAQDDAGLTQDFDLPQLMDGAYGNLPNDRRHTFKLFGSYALNEQWLLGANMLIQSGRPINGFGQGHPDGTPSYGVTYYLDGENRVPRGSFGRTDWITRFDVSMQYSPQWEAADVTFRADVFNIFDAAGVTEVYEFAEQSVGVEDNRFMLPSRYQSPRSVRLSASIRF